MTPHKRNNRGTYVFDRTFRGVGRIRQSSGTLDKRLFTRLNNMLDDIARSDRADLLHAVFEKKVHPLRELYPVYKARGIKGLPTLERLKPLKKNVDAWQKRLECSEKHRQQIGYAFNALGMKKSHTIADLPKLLKAYSVDAKPTMFNRVRSACQAFARDTAGRYSELWREVSQVLPKKTQRKDGHPQTPKQAESVRLDLGDYGQIWWSMCCTGMGPKELGLFPGEGGDWEVKQDRVLIHGTKAEARDRVVPLIETPVRPNMQYAAFRRALAKHRLTPYDGRRTFLHWLEMAKIPRSRIEYYAGHKAGRDVTSLYLDHDVGQYLAKDRRAVRAYLRRELSKLRLEKPA